MLKIEYVKLDSIKPYERNAKLHPQEQVDQIKNSIQAFGFNDPLGIWHGEIVEGHGRYIAAQELGMTEIPIIRLDGLTDEQRRAYMLVHNQLTMNSGFDLELLNAELADILNFDMSEFGFDTEPEIPDEKEIKKDENIRLKLADRFIIPPLSVLDARQGYWQERKSIWIKKLHIDGTHARQNLVSHGSLSGTTPGYYKLKEKKEAELGTKLTNKEFEDNYLKAMLPQDSTIKNTATGGILSVFDPVLCEIMYYWFAPKNGTILDPFAGGSTRGIVASMTGHEYTGVDLSKDQIEENKEQVDEIIIDTPKPKYIHGNSLNIDTLIQGQYDFIFSCPPYFDLEKYSDDPNDLSNMNYDEFKQQYKTIIQRAVSKLKPDRFAVFVVGDIRDTKNGVLRNFVSETIQDFIDAGCEYYNEIILVTPLGSLPLRVANGFKNNRKIGKTHQNVLVFYKGEDATTEDETEQQYEEIGEEFNENRTVAKTHENVLVFYKGNTKKIKENLKPVEENKEQDDA